MKNKLLLTVFLAFCTSLAEASSADTLSWNNLLAIIKANHPVMQQAKLQQQLARARRTQAIGAFDPKLGLDYDRKLFDGTEYYTFVTPEIKLPLWYGAELKANYTDASGAYINPENKVPKEGLAYAGLSIPLGKGLFIDKRRAGLQQARLFENLSENEQKRLLNDLVLEAGERFIDWQNKHRLNETFENAVSLAKVRLDAMKKLHQGGDRPLIDTVEAAAQLQQREIQAQLAKLELQAALLQLSNFMWLENNQPVAAEKLNLRPHSEFKVPAAAATDLLNNPKLREYEIKLQQLSIDRRLKAENLKPELNLQLGLLNTGRTALANLNPGYWNRNNKIGLSVSLPLTFSQARGELAEAKIKIRDTEFDQMLAKQELQTKLLETDATIANIKDQLRLLNQSLTANQQLLKGEETRFKLGESSLFLINARESKVLEVIEKLTETEAKLKKAELKRSWLTSDLVNLLN